MESTKCQTGSIVNNQQTPVSRHDRPKSAFLPGCIEQVQNPGHCYTLYLFTDLRVTVVYCLDALSSNSQLFYCIDRCYFSHQCKSPLRLHQTPGLGQCN